MTSLLSFFNIFLPSTYLELTSFGSSIEVRNEMSRVVAAGSKAYVRTYELWNRYNTLLPSYGNKRNLSVLTLICICITITSDLLLNVNNPKNSQFFSIYVKTDLCGFFISGLPAPIYFFDKLRIWRRTSMGQ